jgi:tRNA (adenine57-N1/adenine58-N1)-methyltransferase
MTDEGTRVIIVDESGRKHTVRLEKRMIEVPGLGVIDGSALCEAGFGKELRIGTKKLIMLRPSLKDLLGAIERKAQIITSKDSFIIPLHLDLGCGSRVIEAGVGSAGLTLVLLKAVGPHGRVYSYEVRDDFAATARRNVAMAEGSSTWELAIDDVCTADLPQQVDAAVLDIPNPSDALANVISALRVGGHVCVYVPNANQLEDAVRKMRELGLGEITAFETIQREMVVHEGGVRPSFETLGHTGYLAFGRKMRA